MEKLAFELHLDEAPLTLKVMAEIRRRYGIEVVGVSLGRRWQQQIQAANMPSVPIDPWLRSAQSAREAARIVSDAERSYGVPTLINCLLADRFLSQKPMESGIRYLAGHIQFWQHFHDEVRPIAVYGPGAAFMVHLTAHYEGQQRGIPYVGILNSRIPNGRVALCSNLCDTWDHVSQRYKLLRDSGLSQQQRQLADGFLEEFSRRRLVPAYMSLGYQRPRLRLWGVRELARRLGRYYLLHWGDSDVDYYTQHPLYYVRRDLRRIASARLAHFARAFELPVPGEPFLLFPLQLHPEASTLVQAPHYVDQVGVVEAIARMVPCNVRLYVKEHISNLGLRPSGFYARLRAIPNVRLVAPWVHPHDLIRDCLSVITISSTMGWEALLYRKPTAILGEVFYREAGIGFAATSYATLEEFLRKPRIHADAEERLKAFVVALHEGTAPGMYSVPAHDPSVLSEENVRFLADLVVRHATIGGPGRSHHASMSRPPATTNSI